MDEKDKEEARFALNRVSYWTMMGLIRFMVEEKSMPADTAQYIILDALEQGAPVNESTGAAYNEVRNMVLGLSEAISGFPLDAYSASGKLPRHGV